MPPRYPLIRSALSASEIHSESASSHNIGILSAAEASMSWHTRLHSLNTVMRRLHKCCAYVPEEVLCHRPMSLCGACTEANTSRLSFSTASDCAASKYSRSERPGQLVYQTSPDPSSAQPPAPTNTLLLICGGHLSRYKWANFMRNTVRRLRTCALSSLPPTRCSLNVLGPMAFSLSPRFTLSMRASSYRKSSRNFSIRAR